MTAVPGSHESRIYEGGYRRYDGVRLGPEHAFWSLWRHTIERIIGMRRPARSKVLPLLAAAIAFIPPAVFVGIAAFLPRRLADAALPSYADIYGFISAAILLFVTFVAPEALCPDRRSGVLSLYLASPLRRTTYLLAKAAAIFASILIVTLGPPLLLLIGLSLQSAGPDGVGDLFATLGRILLAGTVMAAIYTGLSVGIASLTDRRAWAAATTLVFVNVTSIVAGTLVFAAGLTDYLLLLSLTRLPFRFAAAVHGSQPFGEVNHGVLALGLASAAWVVAGGGLALWRYRRLQVTR